MSDVFRTLLALKTWIVAISCTVIMGWCAWSAAAEDIMGMAVENVQENGETITVETTGAKFIFEKGKDEIACYQRIPIERKVATVSGVALKDAHVKSTTARECQIATRPDGNAAIVVGLDSLMTVSLGVDETVAVAGTYKPAYIGQERPHFLLPDDEGGIGLYVLGGATCQAPEEWEPGWQVQYAATEPSRLLLSVFPPKPFDWKQSYETMVHSFSWKEPYPTDEQLKEWRNYGSVLTLHSWIWKGQDGEEQYGIEQDKSWSVAIFKPKSAEEMLRVVNSAHRLGMKVIPYMSPYYFTGGSIDDFVRAVEACQKRYGFDGVYFDGVPHDIDRAYDVTRRVRELIGDEGILYIHCTGSPLNEIYCPFIDCYADYILRGEHRNMNEQSARWYVSSYSLGNSIGTFCYDTRRPTKDMIELMFRVNARLPFWVQHGTWRGLKYHLTEKEKELMLAEYLPRIEREKESRADSDK